ncbi:hypothetical protein [Legionella taurinensis]|uniref:Dot/Icm T4SS effector n=1 Tax=Legionella taurinensis TaxID=70611 RepID=A0A3A5LDH8_9GAMM|nr:hypothetical protein [Legionella taurinensis]RJT45565.1 hypothetical protein D6J04_10585 [Legionella taurinensis]RJT66181.1 hypothetical protein D6J03_11230 [Legionella taurinensis]STY26294.1 Dot/Icm T4SS effector [Legionella taurinensis]
MGKIGEIFASKIDEVSNKALKSFLLEHFNPKAETQAALFCKVYASSPQRALQGRATLLDKELSYQNALSMVFAYAPEEVCDRAADVLLGMEPKDMVELLSAFRTHPANDSLNERVMHTLMHYAPPATRKKLLAAIKSLPMDTVVILLFGKDYFNRYFSVFTALLNADDQESLSDLLSILHGYSQEEDKKGKLYDLLQTDPFPSRAYTALIDLFKLPLTDEQALRVLSILAVYDKDRLMTLTAGISGQFNLLHRVFESQSEIVVAKLLTILEKLPDEELKSLLTARASFKQNETPLSIAFSRKNCPAIACQLIDFVSKRQALKPLLKSTSLQQPFSPVHHAVLQHNTAAVAHYLKQDSEWEHKTSIGSRTLLDLANEKQHHELVYLLQIHQARRKDNRETLTHFVTHADAHAARAWAYELDGINPVPPTCTALQAAFEQVKPTSVSDALIHYCLEKNDTFLYFLLLTSRLLFSQNGDPLEAGVRRFIEKALRELDTQTSHALANGLQLQLITLFFTLPSGVQTRCMERLQLDEQQKKQWAAVLFRGLIQPAVYSTLTLKEHAFFLDALEKLSGEKTLPIDLANHYLLHAPLEHLPPQWVLALSDLVSISQLNETIKKKRNPLVLLLTLQKHLTMGSTDEAAMADLYKQLGQELALIRQDKSPMTPKEKVLLLNLAQHPKLTQWIQEQAGDSFIPLVKQTFKQLTANTAILPQSLLRDMLLKQAKTPQAALNPENQPIYSVLFSMATPKETSALLTHLQPTLEQAAARRDEAFVKTNHAGLHESLRRVRSLRYRLDLVPFTEQLEVLRQSLPLEPALSEFKHQLDELCSLLSRKRLEGAPSSVFDSELKSSLKTSSDLFSALGLRGAELLKNSPWPITDFTEIIEHIRTLAKHIDDEETKLTASLPAQPLQEQEHFLSQFRQAVIQGLLTNDHIAEQLPSLFYWYFMSSDAGRHDAMHEQIQALREQIPAKAWVPIQQQLNQFLLLRRAASPVILALNTLLNDSLFFDLDALLHCLDKIPAATLEQFKAYCALCHQRDLLLIVDYVIESKLLQLPLKLEDAPPVTPLSTAIDFWLKESLNSLEKQAARALSCSALISGFDLKAHPVSELKRLNQVIADQDVPLDAKTLAIFISAATDSLEKSPPHTITDFIPTLNTLLSAHRILIVTEMINQLPPSVITSLTTHCLAGLNSNDRAMKQASRDIMTLLCQCASQSEENLAIIKANLGAQDLSLLGDEQLITMAGHVLKQEHRTLAESTLNGVWIQRLLTSPQFVAVSTPEAIRALLERYRFLSLTLKQAEFEQLNAHIKSQMVFFKHHAVKLAEVDEQMAANASLRARLLEKRQRLLQFRADDSIRALLMQLEDACFALRKDDPTMANAALNVLYSHYNASLSSLRSDWLFKVADFVFEQSTASKGDLALAQNTFLGWLQKYLPHKNFEQSELARKQSVLLYDVTGKEIGFINEANQAMTFVDDIPKPLIELRGYSAGISFYDNNRYTLGVLLPSGEVKRTNLFQKETSALLLAKVPVEQLSTTPATMELLLADAINEESLARLYQESDTEKLAWIKQQVAAYAKKTNKPLPRAFFELLVLEHGPEASFNLLAAMPLSQNSHSLFQTILEQEGTREQLFSNERTPVFQAYLDKHDPVVILADFLEKHHSKPYFAQGLQAFADYAVSHNQRTLLLRALTCLQEKRQKNAVLDKQWDTLMTALIAKENIARLVWRAFLDADINSPLDTLDSTLSGLTAFFQRAHCTPVIAAVNRLKINELSTSYQYRLLLLILHRQRQDFFQRVELRYSPDHWTSDELSGYSLFVKRHFGLAGALDHNKKIGKKLVSELVFRTANCGNTSLFYHQNQFDSQLAGLHFERSTLNAIAARHFIPPAFKEKLQEVVDTLAGWFNGEAPQTKKTIQELKANKAIIDWKEINKQSWAMTDSLKMPLISAYLANYSGDVLPLKNLLNDYCKTAKADLLPLSEVMVKLPNRNVSPCIFQALEQCFTAKPSRMDYTLFSQMAVYHAQNHLKRKSYTPQQCQLALIEHFGQQKKYDLVRHACELYKTNSPEKKTNPKIEKIHLEAVVEGELNAHVGSWYFKFWQLIKRWWHYGITGSKTPSAAVVFCDRESRYDSPVVMPKTVTTPELNGGHIEAQLTMHQKLKNLRQRYDVFVAQQPSNKTDALPPVMDLSKLFFHPIEPIKVEQVQPALREVVVY